MGTIACDKPNKVFRKNNAFFNQRDVRFAHCHWQAIVDTWHAAYFYVNITTYADEFIKEGDHIYHYYERPRAVSFQETARFFNIEQGPVLIPNEVSFPMHAQIAEKFSHK